MLLHKKLNVGCGFDKREGYTNVDLNAFHDPDLVADITHLHQVPDGYADEVLANDVLEHVPGPKVMPALVEWNRVLRLDGVLRLRVPDLESIARMLLAGEHKDSVMAMLFGTQAYAGDFHMSGFTLESLARMLDEAGFSPPTVEIVDSWLLSATAVKVRDVRSDVFALAKDSRLGDTEFVEALYIALLGRKADEGGLQHFVECLRDGTRDRYQTIKVLASSDEAQVRQAALIETV